MYDACSGCIFKEIMEKLQETIEKTHLQKNLSTLYRTVHDLQIIIYLRN